MSKINFEKTIDAKVKIANKVKKQTVMLAKQKLEACKLYLSETNEDFPKALAELAGAMELLKPFAGKK